MGWNGQRVPRFGDRGGRLEGTARKTCYEAFRRWTRFQRQGLADMNQVRGVGGCQKTAVDHLAVRFWKISTRSSDLQLQDGQISVRSFDTHPWKSSQASFCAKHRCRRLLPRPYAKAWPLMGRGETGGPEDAKTPLCTTWRYGFARSR